MPSDPREVLAALCRGRRAVESYVRRSAEQRRRNWNEESATERLLMDAWPQLRYVEFTRPQERSVGADWLWWFTDRTGEALGILVQAKQLKVTPTGLKVDFKYPKTTGEQLDRLVDAAGALGVPAAYALYCGDAEYRAGRGECPDAHAGGLCLRCERASVLILPALTAQDLRDLSARDAGARAFTLGVPLEQLLDPDIVAVSLVDECDTYLGEPIMQLLLDPHTGVREIARKIIEACPGRQWAASVAPWVDLSVPDFPEALGEATVFDMIGRQDDDDYDHFGTVLRGLRRTLPSYVRTALDGGDLPPELSGYIDGIALVDL